MYQNNNSQQSNPLNEAASFIMWTILGAIVVAICAAILWFTARYVLPLVWRILVCVAKVLDFVVMFVGGLCGGFMASLLGSKMPDPEAAATHICGWLFCVGMVPCCMHPVWFWLFVPVMALIYRVLGEHHPSLD